MDGAGGASVDCGEAVLEAFRRLGVDYVMASPGSEWGSVWEAFARQDESGSDGPVHLSCAHETLAVGLATGYTAMTGRLQAVMLHTGVGLLQGSIGLDAANRQGIPMLVLCGEAATYGEREGFDPGPQWLGVLSVVGGPHGLVAPIVKWSHPVSSSDTLHEQLVRAGEMARRTPAGPVVMTVPIESMLQAWTPPGIPRPAPPAVVPQAPGREIDRVAALLAEAEAPVIVAESIGSDVEGHEATVALAELLAIPVWEGSWLDFNNFPRDHPLYQGIGTPDGLHEADVVLTLRARAPWSPPGNRPARATVVNVDEAPFRPHMVHQNLQADIFLEGDAVSTLRRLTERLGARTLDAGRIAGRLERWTAAHERMRDGLRAAAAEACERETATATSLCAALSAAMPADTIYVDETITPRPVILRHLELGGPKSYFKISSGGLGQGLGLALGAKLALPERTVALTVGDGAFMYNPIAQSLALSKHRNLPVMVVIFNNRGYASMRNEHHAFYPDGVAAGRQASHGQPITGFDYAELAEPFGFFGRTVERQDGLAAAAAEAAAAVAGGRTAILNVMIEDGPR